MISLHFNIHCQVCGNKEAFYGMPMDEKVANGEEILSNINFLIRCAKCGQKYHLNFNLKRI